MEERSGVESVFLRRTSDTSGGESSPDGYQGEVVRLDRGVGKKVACSQEYVVGGGRQANHPGPNCIWRSRSLLLIVLFLQDVNSPCLIAGHMQ